MVQKTAARMKSKLMLVVLIAIHLGSCASNDSSTPDALVGRSVDDIGNPQTNLSSCGRNGHQSYVCDPDHVLSYDQDNFLDSLIQDILLNTVCPCSSNVCRSKNSGYLVSIALVNKIKFSPSQGEGSHASTESSKEDASRLKINLREAKDLAQGLLKKWNLGTCKESVVILFSRTDNVLYTVADTVAARQLTTDLIGEIAMDVRSDFGQNITRGFEKLLADYKAVFVGKYEKKTKWEDMNLPSAYPVIGASSNALIVSVYISTLVTIAVTLLIQL